MAVILTKGGGMTVRDTRKGDIVINTRSPWAGRTSGGGSSKTTKTNPTPSASELYGTSAQREAQLEAFKSGGRKAFESLKKSQIEKDREQPSGFKDTSGTRTDMAGKVPDWRIQQGVIYEDVRRDKAVLPGGTFNVPPEAREREAIIGDLITDSQGRIVARGNSRVATASEREELRQAKLSSEQERLSQEEQDANFFERQIRKVSGTQTYQDIKSKTEDITSSKVYTALFKTAELDPKVKETNPRILTGTVPITPVGTFIPKVRFLGVTQSTKKGGVATEVVFKVGNKKGIAQSLTNFEKNVAKTTTRGAIIQKGYKFPTGETFVKTPTRFYSRSGSVTRTINKPITLKDIGSAKTVKNIDVQQSATSGILNVFKGKKLKLKELYGGLGESISEKGLTLSKGATYGTKTKFVRSLGLTKEVQRSSNIGGTIIQGSKQSFKTPKYAQAYQQTQQAVTQAFSQPSKFKAGALSVGYSGGEIAQSQYYGKGIYERTQEYSSVTPKQITKPSYQTYRLGNIIKNLPIYNLTSATKQATRTKQKQGLRQQQPSRQNTNQTIKQITKVDTRQIQRQKLSLRQLNRQLYKQTQTPRLNVPLFTFRNIPIGKKPDLPDPLKAKPYKTRKKKKRKGSDVQVIAQGFTAKALGLKKLRIT